jgi:hypothetical protein
VTGQAHTKIFTGTKKKSELDPTNRVAGLGRPMNFDPAIRLEPDP